ncbi:MAG: SDR family NAD(P)-dependent oxidoreductase [Acidimicrobiales bacterium]
MSRWERALVTGASSGIGAEFARALAAEGTNLVLVARRLELLETLAAELRAKGVEVEVLRADLADRAQVEIVAERIARTDAPIDLLINNAGIAVAGAFHEQPLARHEELVAVCALAPMVLTHAAIRAMSARSTRGNIINVSSVCGSGPITGLASYSASKGFLNHLSQAADADIRGRNVVVTAVMPGPTRTEINDLPGAPVDNNGAEVMDARDVAVQSLDAAAKGRRHFVPGFVNQVRTALTPRFSRGALGTGRNAMLTVGRKPSHVAQRIIARLR